MKKLVLIDAGDSGKEIEAEAVNHEKSLDIADMILANRVFANHKEALDFFAQHHEEVGSFFIKISLKEELAYLKNLQELSSETVFMVFTDNNQLDEALLELSLLKNWVHAVISDKQSLARIVGRVLEFAFTDHLKMVEVNGNVIVLDSVLFVKTDARNRNYLHIVLKDNECLVQATLSGFSHYSEHWERLGRGLLVNRDNIRRVEADGLTLCFKGTTKKVTAAKACKKQIKALMLRLQ